jgi:Flp pilus assembly protein TadG
MIYGHPHLRRNPIVEGVYQVVLSAAASNAVSIEPLSQWKRTVLDHLRNGNDGSALVEFAVVLPILLVLITGMFSFGIAINNFLTLTDATSIGARFLATDRGLNLDPCAASVAIVQGTAFGLTPASLSFTFVINGTTYTGVSCNSSSLTTGAAGNMMQGTSAQVTVTYPCVLGVYGKNYVPGCTLSAQTTEIIQ